jgi:hypothetical protein
MSAWIAFVLHCSLPLASRDEPRSDQFDSASCHDLASNANMMLAVVAVCEEHERPDRIDLAAFTGASSHDVHKQRDSTSIVQIRALVRRISTRLRQPDEFYDVVLLAVFEATRGKYWNTFYGLRVSILPSTRHSTVLACT